MCLPLLQNHFFHVVKIDIRIRLSGSHTLRCLRKSDFCMWIEQPHVKNPIFTRGRLSRPTVWKVAKKSKNRNPNPRIQKLSPLPLPSSFASPATAASRSTRMGGGEAAGSVREGRGDRIWPSSHHCWWNCERGRRSGGGIHAGRGGGTGSAPPVAAAGGIPHARARRSCPRPLPPLPEPVAASSRGEGMGGVGGRGSPWGEREGKEWWAGGKKKKWTGGT